MDRKHNASDSGTTDQTPDGLPMPPGGDTDPLAPKPLDLPPPPSFGKQAAQLVIIPAAIVIAAIGFAMMFGMLAGQESNIETDLAKLEQSGGRGRMAGGIQDPRYKDRWLAAYNVATRIPTMEDPVQRRTVSDRLSAILERHVTDDEELIRAYLIMAVGQLGEPGGLDAVIGGFESKHSKVREAAIGGVLSWPDRIEARRALPALKRTLRAEEVGVVTQAAAAVGRIAERGDAASIAALRGVIEATGPGRREAQWNAAVAMAVLGDDYGVMVVTDVLLNREALGKLPADDSSPVAGPGMPRALQNRIMLATLASTTEIDDPKVWAKVEELAESDPEGRIRKVAVELRQQRNRDER